MGGKFFFAKLNLNSIQFNSNQSNSKGKFMGPFLTDSNCHSDICPVNICPGDICPYQEYLSWCLPHYDQTLKVGFWDHL